MLRRYQNIGFAIILAVSSCGPICYAEGAKPCSTNKNCQTKSKLQPSSDALVIKESVDSVTSAIKADTDKAESADEKRRAEQDLKAQKDSANWALWMGLSAAASTIIGGIGLIFLWKTVVYTKKAAQSASDTLHATRAWMIGTQLDTSFFDDDSGRNSVALSVVWKNCGSSPALRGWGSVEGVMAVKGSDIPDFQKPINNTAIAANIGPGESMFSDRVKLDASDFQNLLAQTHAVYVYSQFTYQEIFHPEIIRMTEATFRLTYEGKEGGGHLWWGSTVGPNKIS